MALTEATSRNQVIRKAMSEYRIKREQLQERSPPPDQMTGHLGSFEITEAELLALSPWTAVLESLVTQMRQLADENQAAAKRAAELYAIMMRKNFKGKRFLAPA